LSLRRKKRRWDETPIHENPDWPALKQLEKDFRFFIELSEIMLVLFSRVTLIKPGCLNQHTRHPVHFSSSNEQ